MRILAVDYGDARIGLAVSDPLGIIASPVGTVKSVGMRGDVDMLSAKAKELGATLVVLGLPLNMDGSEGERAEKTRKLGTVLSKVSGLPVELIDERLTTVSAERVLDEAEMRWDKRKRVVDTISAQIILQTYLDKIKAAQN
ncbi:MAG: Holliday junction resolvase RuvX [Clostridia bacterium]|nr:Holliday junction resolvase RuvX [Clostridia bacterium]